MNSSIEISTESTAVADHPELYIGDRTPTDHRRYQRVTAKTEARVKSFSRVSGELTNFSETGLNIQLPQGVVFHRGQDIRVQVPSLPGKTTRATTLSGSVRHRTEKSNSYGVRLDSLLSEQISVPAKRLSKIVSIGGIVLLTALIAYLKSRNIVSFWYGPLIQAYSIGAAVFVLSRVVLSIVYRAPKDNGFQPFVSLIVAVKNEEAHIVETVMHCLASRYPKEKLEVIVVDDGSTDNTWAALSEFQKKETRMRSFQFPENRGKRHAMALGSRHAKGDILIFIDSDTFLEEEAIYRLVQPFADPRVGAVAGHTLVIVEEDNFISKMEAVRYYVSQRIMKAAESVFNSVTCCPGPLSGYRKAAVLAVLDQWENQMFLGTKATFGDDRSLTNFILRNYRVVYHAGARCATYVPNKLSVLIRQQLRWKKSWLRELTVASRFMWTKHPIAAFSYYAAMVITLVSPLIAFGALIGLPIIGVPFNMFGYIGGLLLAYALLGLIFRYHTQSRHWYYGLYFALLYVCIFSFQNYYALWTVRRNQWGTR